MIEKIVDKGKQGETRGNKGKQGETRGNKGRIGHSLERQIVPDGILPTRRLFLIQRLEERKPLCDRGANLVKL